MLQSAKVCNHYFKPIKKISNYFPGPRAPRFWAGSGFRGYDSDVWLWTTLSLSRGTGTMQENTSLDNCFTKRKGNCVFLIVSFQCMAWYMGVSLHKRYFARPIELWWRRWSSGSCNVIQRTFTMEFPIFFIHFRNSPF